MEETVGYEELVKKYDNTIVMRLRGMFYNAFDSSAIVLSLITSYKVKKPTEKSKCKCGFPEKALERVMMLCEEHTVDFIVFSGDEIIEEKHFINNQFTNILEQYNNKSKFQKQKVVTYECYGNDLTMAYVELQQKIDVEMKTGYTVVTMSCNYVKREISDKYILSGIVVYEKQVE